MCEGVGIPGICSDPKKSDYRNCWFNMACIFFSAEGEDESEAPSTNFLNQLRRMENEILRLSAQLKDKEMSVGKFHGFC